MEYLEGGNLKQVIAEQSLDWDAFDIKPKEALSWCCQLASVLAEMHGQSPPIIHRDVKCENIMLSRTLSRNTISTCFSSGSSVAPAEVALIDFGLSRTLPTPTIQSPPISGLPSIQTPTRSDSEATWSKRLLRLKPYGMVSSGKGSIYSMGSRIPGPEVSQPLHNLKGLPASQPHPPSADSTLLHDNKRNTSASPRLISHKEEDQEGILAQEGSLRPQAITQILTGIKLDENATNPSFEYKSHNVFEDRGTGEKSQEATSSLLKLGGPAAEGSYSNLEGFEREGHAGLQRPSYSDLPKYPVPRPSQSMSTESKGDKTSHQASDQHPIPAAQTLNLAPPTRLLPPLRLSQEGAADQWASAQRDNAADAHQFFIASVTFRSTHCMT